MINSRHLIGQPSFTTKLRTLPPPPFSLPPFSLKKKMAKSPLVAAATATTTTTGGGGWGGIKLNEMLKSFLILFRIWTFLLSLKKNQ